MKPIHLMFKLSRKYTRELVITTLTMLALVGVQLLVPWLVKLIIARLTGDALSADTIRFVNQKSLIALTRFWSEPFFSMPDHMLTHCRSWHCICCPPICL